MIIPGTNIDVKPLEAIPEGAGIAPEFAGRPADALRVPVAYLGITNPQYYNRAFAIRFGKIINKSDSGYLSIREPSYGNHFITQSPNDTIMNDRRHPSRAGMDRYRWFTDPGENVQYGFLIE